MCSAYCKVWGVDAVLFVTQVNALPPARPSRSSRDTTANQAISDSDIAPAKPFEAALLVTLPVDGSASTAIVRGADGRSGIAVVEAYHLP